MSEDPCSQLLVDFPTHRRPTVRFASSITVHPIRSTLTMISHNEELWYSKRDEITMKTQMRIDAITLRSTSAEDLANGGGLSQMVGLEALVVSPAQAKKNRKIKVQHRMAVVQLQDLTSDEELCRVSQISSCDCSERAHKVAKAYIDLDIGDAAFGMVL